MLRKRDLMGAEVSVLLGMLHDEDIERVLSITRRFARVRGIVCNLDLSVIAASRMATLERNAVKVATAAACVIDFAAYM